MKPNIDNHFIGIGGFDTKKFLLAYCGLCLRNMEVREILVTNEMYGPVVADNRVMLGKDYVVKCKVAL